ncbi:MAG: SCP2 sterol-binding domain-containing protein [Bdellovibrionales bacterium]|nr:SCP2 sterol-binding domain-containing protein [Bdellovibrionales bacterium]
MNQDDRTREPVVLEPESGDSPDKDEVGTLLEAAVDIHATREEAVAEAQAEDADSERAPLTVATDDEEEEGLLQQARGAAQANESDEQEEEEDKAESEDSRRARKPRGGWRSLDELFSENLENFSFRMNPNLSAHLAGDILIDFRENGRSFAVSVSGTSVSSKELGKGKSGTFDCEIAVSERDFLDLVNGNLNPQVAMLSERVQVTGRLDAAVYLFNLFHAPVRL